jgi:DNA topoisomerase-1
MRTDANRLAEPFIQETQSYIEKEFGKSYLGKYRVTTKDNAQDAHEAIRPTSIHRTPDMMQDYLSKDELKLYKRIYERTVASLMSPAIFDVTKVTFESNGHIYQASGEIEKFKGFQAIYTESKHKDKILPHLTEGQTIDAKEVNPIEKVTTPPTRYSEATLIKDLESLGIGRPSTYASILQTLKARDYVELVEKRFKPTDQGKLTSEQLDEFFHKIINVEYTSKMETVLDEIAEGKKNGGVLIDQFYKSFIPLVDHAQKHMKKIGPKLTDELCPMCGKPLVVRMSKYGEFIACSGFPKCKYVKKTTE